MPKIVAEKPETAFRNAKPGKTDQRISDGKGLFLLVGKDGSKRWRFQYSRPGGGRNTLSLGNYPETPTASARAARDEARRLLQEGIDPGELRKSKKAMRENQAANSFESVSREWIEKQRPSWSKDYANRVEKQFERWVYPWLGATPVAEVAAPDLLKALRRVEDLGKLETTRRVLADSGRVFRYAIATGRAERDPAADLRGALAPVQTKHFAAVTDPDGVGQLLRAIEGHRGGLIVRSALRLAPLVFVRPGELRRARWADIDLDTGEWRFTVSKTRKTGVAEHIVPLSKQALTILRDLHALTGGKEYVFPATRGQGKPMSENTVNAALRSLGYDNKTMVGHGWRATARTLLDEVLGYPPHIIEQQLAHAVKDPLGRAYNRTAHLPQRREMMQQWSDYLDSLREGKVVQLKVKTA